MSPTLPPDSGSTGGEDQRHGFAAGPPIDEVLDRDEPEPTWNWDPIDHDWASELAHDSSTASTFPHPTGITIALLPTWPRHLAMPHLHCTMVNTAVAGLRSGDRRSGQPAYQDPTY